jgi:hypothetical protein
VAVPADHTPPTATITSTTGAALPIALADPISFNVVFNKPVSGFTTASVALGGTQKGGTVQSVTPSADGKSYTVTVGGFTQQGTLDVTIPPGAVADSFGNLNQAIGPVTVATPGGVAVPTATITSPSGTLPVTFTANPLTLTVTFSEAVTGFTAADVQIGGTAKGGQVLSIAPVGTNGTTFTVTLGNFSAPGSVTVALPAGAATSAGGIPSAALAAVTAGRFAPPFSSGFAVGGGEGQSQPFFAVDQNLTVSPAVNPFESTFTGGVRVAMADVNGDGTLDVIVGSGPGRVNEVKVYDGRDNTKVLLDFSPFEPSFTGGVFVAGADMNGDGKAEIIVSPDVTGGPRVQVLDGAAAAAGKQVKLADFFGIADPNFRGGARVGSGDVNGDGVPDLIVAAGFGGGPRVAIFDGKQLMAGNQVRVVGDFFAFEQTLRNGVYVAGGDVNADGFADVVLGAGPGGGPRVRVLDGKQLLAGNQVEDQNFFAGDPNNRGGVRVASRDLDGDGKADVITGPGNAGGSTVSVYESSKSSPTTLDLFGGFNNGVFVG